MSNANAAQTELRAKIVETAKAAGIDWKYINPEKDEDLLLKKLENFGLGDVDLLDARMLMRALAAEAKQQQQQQQVAVAPPTTDYASKKQKVHQYVEFVPAEKGSLEPGEMVTKVGFVDRENAIGQLYGALEGLATRLGDPALDKKKVPIIGLMAQSEAGKTEFLRWVFNHCCTFRNWPDEDPGGIPGKALLERLNASLPPRQQKMDNLLVLFSSFNQTSTYTVGEGDIKETTIERLLRSYHGNDRFGDDDIRFGVRLYKGIIERFPEKTGFIFLLDELSKVKDNKEQDYNTLLDSILGFSQQCLRQGTFCAVVGSALSVYDLGKSVVSRSGRAIEPVHFPKTMKTMEERTVGILRGEVDALDGSRSNKEAREYALKVTMKILQSSSSLGVWEDYVLKPGTMETVAPPVLRFNMPLTKAGKPMADYVFLVASRTALGKETVEALDSCSVDAIVDTLCGQLVLETKGGRVLDFKNPRGTLSLHAWRLLQIPSVPHKQLFRLVQNWVLVETRRMFFHYLPTQQVKTWETSIMALLELRKAMLQAVNNVPPSLGEIIEGIGVHHNISSKVMARKASSLPASDDFTRLPTGVQVVKKPTIYQSDNSNEEAVEGVARECFKGLQIFFQMKLYKTATPKNIRDWLVAAHGRALQEHYREGKYIVMLFVTGVIDDNLENYRDEWPEGSLVFSDQALIDLFEPFGDGLIQEIVKNIKRD